MRILEVAVPGPFREGLDYLLDDTETQDAELIGRRVFVPLGKGQRVGVILKVKSQSAFERSRLKKINEIIDAEPLFSPSLQQLIHWVSQYYHHPIGEAYQTAMNTAMAHGLPIEPDVEATWALTTAGENIDPDSLKRSPAQRSALQQLRQFGKLDRSCFEKANISSNTLKTLEEKGWIARFNQPLTLPDNTPTDLQKELNPEQLSALNALLKAGNQFQVHLLEGVTGSGKTEVYLQRIAPLIEAGK
ncbi:MAG: hypothetical protein EBX40_07965, partial [Gammaproteobacteria bacterium]|nr:hypothetical protein [Gammaproteobacteria bacterium]